MEDAEITTLKEIIERNIESGVYIDILNAYNDAELKKLNSYLRHSRDFWLHAGLQQGVDKYLVQDRRVVQYLKHYNSCTC